MAIVQQIMNHLGGTAPDSETHKEADAVRELQQLMAERGKKNPILLVLDDIWSGSESILEKFVNKEIPNYKVLVTSRFEFPAFGFSYKLEGLEKEDAVKLLRHAATPHSGSHSLPNDEIVYEVIVSHVYGCDPLQQINVIIYFENLYDAALGSGFKAYLISSALLVERS